MPWTARVRLTAVQYFSLLQRVQTGSGAQPASYPMGTAPSFHGGKAARREAPTNAEGIQNLLESSLFLSPNHTCEVDFIGF
jgi:hypothetical protein